MPGTPQDRPQEPARRWTQTGLTDNRPNRDPPGMRPKTAHEAAEAAEAARRPPAAPTFDPSLDHGPPPPPRSARFAPLFEPAHNDPDGNAAGLTLYDRLRQRADAIAYKHAAEAGDVFQAMTENVLLWMDADADYTRQTYWRILNRATWRQANTPDGSTPARRYDRRISFSLDAPLDAAAPQGPTIGEAITGGDHAALLQTTIATVDVQNAMMKLPAQYRAIMLRTAIANQTQTKAAAALSISRPQLLRRRRNAIAKLRKDLESYAPQTRGAITAAALFRLSARKPLLSHFRPRPKTAPIAQHEAAGDDRARAYFRPHLEILSIEATAEAIDYRLSMINESTGAFTMTHVHPKTHLDYHAPALPEPPMSEAEAARLDWIEDNTSLVQTPPPPPWRPPATEAIDRPPTFTQKPFTPPPPAARNTAITFWQKCPRRAKAQTHTPPAARLLEYTQPDHHTHAMIIPPPPPTPPPPVDYQAMIDATAAARTPPPPIRPYRPRKVYGSLPPKAAATLRAKAAALRPPPPPPIVYRPTRAGENMAACQTGDAATCQTGDDRQVQTGDRRTRQTDARRADPRDARPAGTVRPSAARLRLVQRITRETRPPARR